MRTDNPVINFLNKMTDLILLNFLFLLTSIPIVTMGASLTAMYAVNLRSIRYGDGYVVRTYFEAFKRNFKQSTLAWGIVLAVAALLYVDYMFFAQMQDFPFAKPMIIVSFAMGIICWIVATWLFPVIAKMDDTLGRQIKNAAAFAFGYFIPYTLVCMLLQGGVFYLILTQIPALFVLAFIGCAVLTYVMSFFFYKAFSKVIREEPLGDDDPLYGARAKKKN